VFKYFSNLLNNIKNSISSLFNKNTTEINQNLCEDNMKKQNLNNLYIIGFTDNIKLINSYNKEEITQLMIENWIGYFECHKCGKWDYCKYGLNEKYRGLNNHFFL